MNPITFKADAVNCGYSVLREKTFTMMLTLRREYAVKESRYCEYLKALRAKGQPFNPCEDETVEYYEGRVDGIKGTASLIEEILANVEYEKVGEMIRRVEEDGYEGFKEIRENTDGILYCGNAELETWLIYEKEQEMEKYTDPVWYFSWVYKYCLCWINSEIKRYESMVKERTPRKPGENQSYDTLRGECDGLREFGSLLIDTVYDWLLNARLDAVGKNYDQPPVQFNNESCCDIWDMDAADEEMK